MGANMSIDESLNRIEGALRSCKVTPGPDGIVDAYRRKGCAHCSGMESLAALREQIATLTAPPAVPEWEALVRLAYADDGDGVMRVYRITAEYNRVREQVAALTAERDQGRAYAKTLDAVSEDRRLQIATLTAERDRATELYRHAQAANRAEFEGHKLTISDHKQQVSTLEAAAKERDARVERLEGALRGLLDAAKSYRSDILGLHTESSPSDLYFELGHVYRGSRGRDVAIDVADAALSPTSTPSTKPAEAALWRVGSKVPVNLYRGDQIMGQCQTPEIAAEIAAGMNAGRGVRDSPAEPTPPPPAASGTP